MNVLRALQMTVWLHAGCGLLLVSQPCARAAEGNEGITAVASRADKDYVRTKLADGSFQPEGYTFGNGGTWGGPSRGDTIDKLGFMGVARVIAVPLASQNYLPAKDPDKTKLLIMVYWGTTQVPEPAANSVAYGGYGSVRGEIQANPAMIIHVKVSSDARLSAMNNDPPMTNGQMAQFSVPLTMLILENQRRDRLDFQNARMLGYDSDDLIASEGGNWIAHTALGARQRDEVAEIEASRHFVVLMAYDFQLMWKEKKHKLLWETRFSINQRRNDFGKALPAMAQCASGYFGQDSHGLLREQVPEGQIEMGDLKSLGSVPEK